MATKVALVACFLAALWIPSHGDLSTAPITTDWIPKVSRKMTTFGELQTGALQLVKEYDDKLSLTQVQIDGPAQLHRLTQAAGDRLKLCRDTLHRNKAEIEASHAQGPTGGAPASDCCDNLGQLEYDPRFLQQIVNDSCATFTAVTGAPNTVRPAVYDTMKSNIHDMSGVTWQYYGAKEGEYHQFPKNDRSCGGNAHRFRNWYVSAASPKKKNVVIVIDVSLSMNTANRINLAKQAALTVLDTLTARDWAGVVSFSERAETPLGCLGDSLGEANPGNIDIMRDFINNLRPVLRTFYAKGFKKAFDIFYNAKQEKPEQFFDSHNVIIFLTDGVPSDPRDVLDQINEDQNRMSRSVHIFTYGLGDSLQNDLSGWCHDPSDRCSRSASSRGFLLSPTVGIPALDFLATIADQNNINIPNARDWTNENCRQDTYGPCSDTNSDPQGVGPPGRTESVGDGDGDRLMSMMGSYYDFFQSEPEPTFSVPTKDDHLGLTITAAIRTVDANDVFFGVTAVDISMDIVFNEIVNFNVGSYSHAFLVDREDGRVLVHRDLPKPMEWTSDPTFLHLDEMKGALNDAEVTKILNGETGSCSLDNVKVSIARGNVELDGVITVEKKATFYYEPIPGTKYSVILCLFDEDSIIAVPTSVNPTIDTDSLYHRLDLLNTTTGVCRLYNNYATLDGSTIMFSPEAYSDPIGYLSSLETSEDVENIEQFLNDLSGSVDNPGLVDGVRTDVILTAAIEQYWRESDADSVWRYVGTRNGMFRIFPGIAVDRRYDPTQQAWYMRALSRPQDYTFSRPVPSPFGGGSMVTISRVISHTSSWEILGVTAADITERKYHSLLYMEIPECLSAEFECFLLDDSGYFMELPTAPSMEHDHLTNRFPWLANELVGRGEFLMSGWCSSYVNHNSQLYYDTSGFTGLNVTSGLPCTQFSMYPVNNTNTFLLVLPNRHTNNCDDSQIQDCSCDEDCQTCDTNAQLTCQCPCSCAWDYASCTNGILGVLTDVPCPPPRGVQSTGMGQTDGQPRQPDSSVQDCEEMCSAQSDSITCEALPHCDWCQELDFPVCKETCVPTTPTIAATTTTKTTQKSTADAATEKSTTIAEVAAPDSLPTGPSVDCSTMPAGMYPDPQDCTMFYQCLAGNAHLFHMPCAPGTLFDWNLAVCTLTSHCTTYIDECTDGSHTCSPDASCTNTVGSFDCICNSGYNGNGFTCTDDNECADGSHNCSPKASCTNTVGSFTCACTPGYSGDGVTCTDIDECADGTHNCSPDATCTNTPGTFTCACNSGYSGDGVSCTAGSVVDCGPKPAGMYPDPHDCTKFYQCTGDPNNPLPVHKDCAPGTLFDWNLYVCTLTSHCTASATLASETPTNAPPTALLPTDAQITAKPTPEEDTTDVAPTKGPRTTLQQTADAAFGVTTDHLTLPQTTAIVTKVVTESTFKPLHSEDVTVCTNEYMELALPADQLTHVITSGLHWDPDPSCKATFNGTHYILRTGLYQCGTTVTFDTKYVIFYNNVSLMFTHDGVITRDPDVVIHSVCKYERDEVVLSEFLPIPGGLEFVDEGFGQLSIRLDLFPTQSYLAPYSTPDYPVHYHLRDRMYLQLQVQGHARQLSVIALHCEATSGRNTSLQYSLIQDGCASDDTLQLYTNFDPATQRFSLEAFRFVQEVTTIHIRCEVEVCDAADTGSRCAQGCMRGTNRHHKRALEDKDDMKSRFVISRGPIILDADFQQEGNVKRAALLIGGSVVVITLAAVLVAVKVRRSKRVHPGYQQLINLDVE